MNRIYFDNTKLSDSSRSKSHTIRL